MFFNPVRVATADATALRLGPNNGAPQGSRNGNPGLWDV